MIVAVSQDGNRSETAEHQEENPRVTNTAVGTTRSVMIAASTVSTNAERNVLKIQQYNFQDNEILNYLTYQFFLT